MKISKLNQLLVWYCVLFCLCGYPISILSGLKLHYFVFVFLCIPVFILNYTSTLFLNYRLLYLISLFIPTSFYLIINRPDLPFIYSALNYLIVPLVFCNKKFSDFKLTEIFGIFHFFTFLNLIGLITQLIGIESPILQQDFAITNEVVHERYGSLAGGSLVLGFIASLSCIFSFYDYLCLKKKSTNTYLLLANSLLTLIIAQARRFYIIVLVIVFIMYIANLNKTDRKKIVQKIVYGLFVIALVMIVLFQFRNSNFYISRFFSTFDFTGDASNALRAILWFKAFNVFLDNFWFGIGMGGIGTIGKDVWENLKDVEDLFVAESYFLKNLVEGGIIFGLTFLWFSIHFIKVSFKQLGNRQKDLAAYIFIFFFLDNFVSTTLETLLASLIFWIAIAILQYGETNFGIRKATNNS